MTTLLAPAPDPRRRAGSAAIGSSAPASSAASGSSAASTRAASSYASQLRLPHLHRRLTPSLGAPRPTRPSNRGNGGPPRAAIA